MMEYIICFGSVFWCTDDECMPCFGSISCPVFLLQHVCLPWQVHFDMLMLWLCMSRPSGALRGEFSLQQPIRHGSCLHFHHLARVVLRVSCHANLFLSWLRYRRGWRSRRRHTSSRARARLCRLLFELCFMFCGIIVVYLCFFNSILSSLELPIEKFYRKL